MTNKVEQLINLIYMTDFMNDLFLKDFNTYAECIKKTQNLDLFKKVEDVLSIEDVNIKNALIELIKNQKLLKILKQEKIIDIELLEKYSTQK